MKRFTVVFERDEDNWWIVTAPELEGCFSQGLTLDEARVNIREAILTCFEEEFEFELDEDIRQTRMSVDSDDDGPEPGFCELEPREDRTR